MFHEMPLKLCFMKYSERKASQCILAIKQVVEKLLRQRNTVNISFGAFNEIQFQGHFMKHEILSWNLFTFVFKLHCVLFSSVKKIVFTETRYLPKFNSIKLYLLLIKQKQNNSKRPKRIEMKPWLKTRSDKSHVLTYF